MNDGGPAFPAPIYDSAGNIIGQTTGMSLRAFFSAAALTGIKSNPELCRICSDIPGMTQQEAVAKMAVTDADALIAALNNP